jgi:pyridoxamine 5'-phosphate oxidase family protein
MVNPMFSQREIEYLDSQRIVRMATATSDALSPKEGGEGSIQPDVVPVGFDFDGDYFYVSCMNLLKSTKAQKCSEK